MKHDVSHFRNNTAFRYDPTTDEYRITASAMAIYEIIGCSWSFRDDELYLAIATASAWYQCSMQSAFRVYAQRLRRDMAALVWPRIAYSTCEYQRLSLLRYYCQHSKVLLYAVLFVPSLLNIGASRRLDSEQEGTDWGAKACPRSKSMPARPWTNVSNPLGMSFFLGIFTFWSITLCDR